MKREKRTYVDRCCLGCCFELIAFPKFMGKDGILRHGACLYLTVLSNHAGAYDESWRGRLRNAWRSLRGEPACGIEIMTREDCHKLAGALKREGDRLWPEEPIA